ncbi:MAG: MFS transporter [Chloroflexi bacterium]|nr:MFS transporter [Chloroflexota bacterium]
MSRQPSSPLRIRDFRLLWLGEAVSAIGDQFALIALPWLALVLTGNALALGGVLAVMAIPRALLMVVGGVWVDRMSPRSVMLASNAVRLVAVAVLGVAALEGAIELWMLYAFALVFGVADAFFFPAQTSIVPQLVEPDQLQKANGIVQGTAQAAVLIGPAAAGGIIAAFGSAGAAPNQAGVGIALLLDAGTFLASIVTLWLIRGRAGARAAGGGSLLGEIGEGVRFVLRAPALRVVVLLSLAANLLLVGPFEVGMPVIAYTRLPEGAAAYGIVLSAFGGGSLIGLSIAALLPTPAPRLLGTVVMVSVGIAGSGVAALAFAGTTLVAAVMTAIAGMALGYGNLLGLTWMQARIPSRLMGRVMSLMMLGSMGLVPVSQLVAGAAITVSLDGMLIAAGAGMAVLALGSLLSRTIRDLGLTPIVSRGRSESPAEEPASEWAAADLGQPTVDLEDNDAVYAALDQSA